ncbi:hypothetical protein [Thiorhodococcus mannitoliphagus]|nr:hypothetical protein [Thiorhodococcus mannitoliphagus]
MPSQEEQTIPRTRLSIGINTLASCTFRCDEHDLPIAPSITVLPA